jgi:hypothetical protein
VPQVIYEFIKCDSILICSINLDKIQSSTFTLMQIVYWWIESSGSMIVEYSYVAINASSFNARKNKVNERLT